MLKQKRDAEYFFNLILIFIITTTFHNQHNQRKLLICWIIAYFLYASIFFNPGKCYLCDCKVIKSLQFNN